MMEKTNTKDKKIPKSRSCFLLLTFYFSLKKAQTAMELAVFGAILIFVVGVIIRQALSAGYMQNQSLRAMRQAMTASYRYSGGLTGLGSPPSDGTASHQTANILFIEDRLTADSAKYAAVDRTPYVVGASATYSRNLFLPLDVGEEYNLPVYDIFINGKLFPFTTAAFKRVHLVSMGPCAGKVPCDSDCSNACSALVAGYRNPEIYQVPDPAVEWEPDCLVQEGLCATMCVTEDCTNCCVPASGDCAPASPARFRRTFGCAKLYDIVYNHPAYPKWCDGESGLCPASNLTAAERFDLDRDGAPGTPDPDVPAGVERERFAWQWYLVMGYDAGFRPQPAWSGFGINRVAILPTMFTLQRGEGIVLENSDCKENCKPPRHTVIDVDGDLKRERVMPDSKVVDPSTGIITDLLVVDQQDGDLDMTRGDSDTGPEPGLAKDSKMYSFVLGGTSLLLEEGRLYDPAIPGQYIRTAQKKDQVDLIERTIQLSNDTGRFCNGSTPVGTGTGVWTAEVPNPVEVCENCSSGTNIQRTCMDRATKSIVVRSRILDRRGRKWVTNTSGDDYVDFTVPSVP